MKHKLNDLKRTFAEATYDPKARNCSNNMNIPKMIEESKQTLRSTEPYIGGESETGERIYRQRNQSRELGYQSNHSVHSQINNKQRLLTSQYSKRANMKTSLDTINQVKDSSMVIMDNCRLDSYPDSSAIKMNTNVKSKARPVSAYTHTNYRKVCLLV